MKNKKSLLFSIIIFIGMIVFISKMSNMNEVKSIIDRDPSDAIQVKLRELIELEDSEFRPEKIVKTGDQWEIIGELSEDAIFDLHNKYSMFFVEKGTSKVIGDINVIDNKLIVAQSEDYDDIIENQLTNQIYIVDGASSEIVYVINL